MPSKVIGLLAVLALAAHAPGDEVKPPFTAVAFAPDGESVFLASQAGLSQHDWPALLPTRTLETQLRHVHDLACSPDGRLLAAVGGRPAESGQLELWSLPELTLAARATLAEDLLYRACWSGDGNRLALAGNQRELLITDRQAREPQLVAGHSGGVLGIVFLPGDGHLISGSLDQTLRVWEMPAGTLARTYNNHTAAVRGVAARPPLPGAPQPVVASAGADRTVRIWWPLVGRLVRFARLDAVPLDIAWTPDGQRILVSCDDGHLRMIDPDTVEILLDVPAIDGWAYALAVAPDGRAVVIAGSNGQVRRLDLP